MRQLATIQRISKIGSIENADRLELASIKGWNVVVGKGEFKEGDLVVYLEIDSFIPSPLPTELEFLSKRQKPKKMIVPGAGEITGHRLKTIKLRGQISQGLILPLSVLNGKKFNNDTRENPIYDFKEGDDVSELLNIIKYEAPIPACLSGQVKGSFPSFLPKTDEERCLSENTKILTEDGIKTIRDICEKKYFGKVASYNEISNKIEFNLIKSHSIADNNNDWYEIETESGHKIEVTSNHKIYIPSLNCYKEVKDLNTNDDVLIFTNNIRESPRPLVVESVKKNIRKIELKSKRYDIEVENNHNFFANNILVHNCQNLNWPEFNIRHKGKTFYITSKLDGTSATFFKFEKNFGVCSRNLELKEQDPDFFSRGERENIYWKLAKDLKIKEKLPEGYCIQGEIVGPGIQNNPLQLPQVKVYFYNVYNIKEGKYLDYKDCFDFIKKLGLETVPLINDNFVLNHTLEELLELANNKSPLNPNVLQEGIVVRPIKEEVALINRNLQRLSFKVVSNQYLLTHEES